MLRCSTEVSNSPKNIYLKNLWKILIRSIKKNNNKKNTPKTPVLGTILCSSSDTNGKSEHYTENAPTTRESISLIWAGPKYSHGFFCSKYTELNLWIEEIVVGNWAESTGNNDSVTQLSPLALKWL